MEYSSQTMGSFRRVIGIGDPLFGSTVTSAHLGQDGYDDATKQVAFDYVLASGERGVATAQVSAAPEPAMLSVPLIVHFLMRRRPATRSRITQRAEDREGNGEGNGDAAAP